MMPLEQTQSPRTLFFQKFEEITEKQPESPAIIYNNICWSYQRLNEEANQIAHKLLHLKKDNSWNEGDCVLFFFENSPEAIATILGIMKAGLAYVPLTPSDRIGTQHVNHYIETAQPKLVIVQNNLSDHDYTKVIKSQQAKIETYQDIIKNSKNKDNPSIKIDPEQLAYIIFSSGSTGDPKGIKIAHRGLLNPILAIQKIFSITNKDRIGAHSLLTFDASIADMMTALATGAAFVIIPRSIRTDFPKLTSYLKQHEVTIITFVASILKQLDPSEFSKLRGIISTGERANQEVFDNWLRKIISLIIVNGYGPSEATICASLAVYLQGQEIHLGEQAIPGLKWFVCKKSTAENPYPSCPVELSEGEEGELYLVGDGVALGYVNKNAPYSLKFRKITDPNSTLNGHFVYQTGDCTLLKNGKMIFKGRIDRQHKFLGELIELDAIENIIKEYQDDSKKKIFSNIELKVVVEPKNKEDPYSLPILRVYFDGSIRQTEKNLQNLMLRLHFYLKYHSFCTIIPSRFSVLTQNNTLPVKNGPNDKKEIDFDKLRNLEIEDYYPTHGVTLETLDEEQTLIRKMWSEILAVPEKKIALDDNFYDLGGHSIHASQLLDKLKTYYPNYQIDFIKFNACPTMRALVFQVKNSINKIDYHPIDLYHKDKYKSDNWPIVLINSVGGYGDKDYQHVIPHFSDTLLLVTKSLSLIQPGYVAVSFEQLAEDYFVSIEQKLKEVYQTTYTGPLVVIGYSAAGTLAYALSKRWQKNYAKAVVCCIDTPSVKYYQKLSQQEYAAEIKKLVNHTSGLISLNPDEIKKFTDRVELNSIEKNEQLYALIQKLHAELADNKSTLLADNKKFINYLGHLATLCNMTQGQLSYQLEPLEDVTLLSFSETRLKCDNDYLDWPQHFPINVVKLEGEHLSVVNKPEWVKNTLLPELKKVCEKSLLQEKLNVLYKKNCYIQPFLSDANARIPVSEIFINLAIIPQNKISTYDRSNSENLYREPERTPIEEINKELSEYEQRILLIGNPGVGKTTLIKYIVDQHQKLWPKQYTGIIWLPLKSLSNKTFDKKKLIADVIRQCCLEQGKEFDLAAIENYLANYKKRKEQNLPSSLLVLCDGFDEVSSHYKSSSCEGNQINQILHAFLNLAQSYCADVIVVSRPYAVADLEKDYTFKKLVNTGFNNQNVEDYLDKFKGFSPDRRKQCLDFLQKNPTIWGIARIPLNLELIATIWSDLIKVNVILENKTLTGLYRQLVQSLFERYLNKVTNDSFDSLQKTNIEEKIEWALKGLGKLAYNMQYSEKKEEVSVSTALKFLKIEHQTVKDEQIIGLFEKIGFFEQAKSQQSVVSFVHKTFREYFTAWYMIYLLGQGTKEQKQEVKKRIWDEFHLGRNQIVCWFMSGLSTLHQNEKNTVMKDFWDSLYWINMKSPLNNASLFARCLEEGSYPQGYAHYSYFTDKISNAITKNLGLPLKDITDELKYFYYSLYLSPKVYKNAVVDSLKYYLQNGRTSSWQYTQRTALFAIGQIGHADETLIKLIEPLLNSAELQVIAAQTLVILGQFDNEKVLTILLSNAVKDSFFKDYVLSDKWKQSFIKSENKLITALEKKLNGEQTSLVEIEGVFILLDIMKKNQKEAVELLEKSCRHKHKHIRVFAQSYDKPQSDLFWECFSEAIANVKDWPILFRLASRVYQCVKSDEFNVPDFDDNIASFPFYSFLRNNLLDSDSCYRAANLLLKFGMIDTKVINIVWKNIWNGRSEYYDEYRFFDVYVKKFIIELSKKNKNITNEALLKGLSHSDRDVRKEFAFELVKLGNKDDSVTAVLIERCHKNSCVNSALALAELEKADEKTISVLMRDGIFHKDKTIQKNCIEALIKLKNKKIIDMLRRRHEWIVLLMLEETDEQIIHTLVCDGFFERGDLKYWFNEKALVELHNEKTISVLKQGLKAKSITESIRYALALTTLEQKDEDVITLLYQGLEQPEWLEEFELLKKYENSILTLTTVEKAEGKIICLYHSYYGLFASKQQGFEKAKLFILCIFALLKIGKIDKKLESLLQGILLSSSIDISPKDLSILGKLSEKILDVYQNLFTNTLVEHRKTMFAHALVDNKRQNEKLIAFLYQDLEYSSPTNLFSAIRLVKLGYINEEIVSLIYAALPYRHEEDWPNLIELTKDSRVNKLLCKLLNQWKRSLGGDSYIQRYMECIKLWYQIGTVDESVISLLYAGMSYWDGPSINFVSAILLIKLEKTDNNKLIDALNIALFSDKYKDEFLRFLASQLLTLSLDSPHTIIPLIYETIYKKLEKKHQLDFIRYFCEFFSEKNSKNFLAILWILNQPDPEKNESTKKFIELIQQACKTSLNHSTKSSLSTDPQPLSTQPKSSNEQNKAIVNSIQSNLPISSTNTNAMFGKSNVSDNKIGNDVQDKQSQNQSFLK